jgi:hypothetical protein
MKVAHAKDPVTAYTKHNFSIQELQHRHESSKFKYKSFVHEQLRKHTKHSDKQNNKMNSLPALLFGQKKMFDGCLEENRDKSRMS